ncbi:hypothetical protein BDR04DRAFT_1163692 [Suillus decipiens]|nr:hypothetical protein BDR04DRAFT_1163692 [Suillus decipiens]
MGNGEVPLSRKRSGDILPDGLRSKLRKRLESVGKSVEIEIPTQTLSPPILLPLAASRPSRQFLDAVEVPRLQDISWYSMKKTVGAGTQNRSAVTKYVGPPTQEEVPSVTIRDLRCTYLTHVCRNTPFPAPVTSTCIFLRKFGITFTPYGFICSFHHKAIPPKALLQHIWNKDHKQDCNAYFKTEFVTMVAHILQSHRVPPDMEVIPIPSTVPELIPGLEAVFSFKCPATNCPEWFKAGPGETTGKKQRRMVLHWNGSHRTAEGGRSPLFEGRYIIRPFHNVVNSTDPLVRTIVVLPETWSPPIPSSVTSTSVPDAPVIRIPTEPPFLSKIKWPDYLQSLQADPAKLRALVKLPNPHRVSHLSERQARLELGLSEVLRLYKGYLKDANQFIESCHSTVRSALTFGTRAKYRLVSDKSYYAYRAPMIRTICMLIRFIHFKMRKKRNPYSGNESPQAKRSLGTFTVTGNTAQCMAANSLYRYIITAEPTSSNVLLELIHDLVASLVRHEIRNSEVMECPTDQALFLSSIRGEDQFQRANPLTRHCAQFSHNFYAVIAQFSRLKDSNTAKFTPFDETSWMEGTGERCRTTGPEELSENRQASDECHDEMEVDEGARTEVELDEDAEDEDEDEDDPVFVLFSDESDSEDEADEEGRQRSANGEYPECEGTFMQALSSSSHPGAPENVEDSSSDLLAIIAEEVRFLKPVAGEHPGYSTPFDRFKGIWHTAHKEAFRESRNFGFSFSADGQCLTIQDGNQQPKTLRFLQLATCAQILFRQLDSNILLTIPSNLHHLYHGFEAGAFTDNLIEPKSIFKQEGNTGILARVISVVQASILTPGVPVDKKAAHQWLKQWDDIMPLIIAVFCLTCGIPPRGFQIHSMTFDHCPITDKARNLFIIDGLPALGNPVAKQRDKGIQECLWLFPQALARPFLFYLGVIRPIIQILLKDLGYNAAYQDTHIFTRAIPQRRPDLPQFWNGSDVNKALQQATTSLPIQLTCAMLRHIITAVFRQHFPNLWDDPFGSSMTDSRAAQTGPLRYGEVYSIPPALGMTLEQAKRYITISQILQTTYGLRPLDDAWQGTLIRSHLFATRKHLDYAFSVARWTVMQQYGLCGEASGIKTTAQNVIKDAPYIKNCIAVFASKIGDAVLIQVSNAVLFGPNTPENFSTPPLGGYLPADIAHAVAFIVLAIEEWADGTFRPVQLTQPFDLAHLKELHTAAEKIMSILKVSNTKGWIKLSADIHTFRLTRFVARHIWSIRGLPEDADGTNSAELEDEICKTGS